MRKFLSQIIMKLAGWKVIDNVPKELRKAVVIAAPHTSNWDFIWAMPALAILGRKTNYLIKDIFFKGPWASIFKLTGGLPVDRSKRNNFTDDLKKLVDSRKELLLLFPPEGTRKRVKRWKTGFYHVARDGNLPIILGFIDYKRKETGFASVYHLTGNFQADLRYLEKFYSVYQGKHPKLFNPEFYEREN